MADEDTGGDYQPLVHLEQIKVTTGEEHETTLAKERCKLYKYDTKADDWKERGTGDVKFLQHNETKRVRIILRQEKTLKLVMNHYLSSDVEWKPNQGSDRAWTWTITDYSDTEKGPELTTFALKFRTAELASEFKTLYDKYRKEQPAPSATASSSTAATSAASSTSTATEAKADQPASTDATESKAKPTDASSTDTKPTDVKPTDTKPADAKPADAKPADAKPAAKPAASDISPLAALAAAAPSPLAALAAAAAAPAAPKPVSKAKAKADAEDA